MIDNNINLLVRRASLKVRNCLLLPSCLVAFYKSLSSEIPFFIAPWSLALSFCVLYNDYLVWPLSGTLVWEKITHKRQKCGCFQQRKLRSLTSFSVHALCPSASLVPAPFQNLALLSFFLKAWDIGKRHLLKLIFLVFSAFILTSVWPEGEGTLALSSHTWDSCKHIVVFREENRMNDESWSKFPSMVQIIIVTKDLKTKIPVIVLDPSYVNLGNYFPLLVLNFSTYKTIIIIISQACIHACSIASAMSDSFRPHGL